MYSWLKRRIYPFVRYCLIGVLVTGIDLGVVFAMKEIFHAPLLWAVLWAFLLANSASFLLNKFWTFKNYTVTLIRQYTKFLIVSVFGLLLTIFLMWLFAEQLHLFRNLTPRYYLICKGLTSVIVMAWNFLSNNIWTFSREVRLFPRFNFSRQYPCVLSVVIPAYNEETRIAPTLKEVINYLEDRKISSEILVVDDGSSDRTGEKCWETFGRRENCRVITSAANHGKGFAVKTGIRSAAGEYILFTDADNSTPIAEFDKFLPQLAQNRILIGSRYARPDLVERRQPWYRILISRAANLLIQLFVINGVKDTQCGFKAFHHEIGDILSQLQRIDRFAFDIEFLSLAQLCGVEINEIPVRWLNSTDSRIRPIRDTLRTFTDLVRIKLNIWTGTYAHGVKSINQERERNAVMPHSRMENAAQASSPADKLSALPTRH
jgi:dolichyl-phosphate beta-glucosyltransferase